MRQEELSTKIQEAQLSNDKQREKALRSIKKVETGRNTYRILRAMRSKQRNSSIDKIEVPASWPSMHESPLDLTQLEDPKTCQDWRTVTDPQELEYYLIMRNRLHFGQAEGTPFTINPLHDDIDWAATSPASEAILQGEYRIDSAFPQCEALLRACKAATQMDAVTAELTMEEFKSKIKSWREATSTSPSGRHLGRYKALFTIVEPHTPRKRVPH